MFKFMSNRMDEAQSTSVPDSSEDASTIISLSDVTSGSDSHGLQLNKTDIPLSHERQAAISGVGSSDEQMSRHQRPLLELVDKLRSLGVQFELDLPQIVAVGMQNVGKSSLIEGICGIKLPRASGTCTRCPIELRMKRSTTIWNCDVSLQIIYDEDGMPLGQAQTVKFGEPIFKPHEVEDRVKRAQWAILNPSVPPRDFLHATMTGASELTFSKNYISIHIQGSNVANLSFVDLPGLVASSRQGNSTDISLIEDLVTSYIQKPSTLILLTVACEADFYTQGAFQIVKNNDPEGSRTIGVLTKPDRIPPGDEEEWGRFIRNDEAPLDLGWFCVKQPDAIQLLNGMGWKQAREAERDWFINARPWNQLHEKYSRQLGTTNLVERLGETLANLIAQRLPALREEIEEALQETEDDMKGLPVPPSEDSLAEMMHLIAAFCAEAARHSEGISASEGLMQSINATQEDFKRSVLSLAPEFRPYKHSESAADLPQLPPCEFLDGEEQDPEAAKSSYVMYVDEVMDLLKRSRTRELPGYYSYEVPKGIIKEATSNWSSIMFSYFDEVWDIVSRHYRQLVEDHFKHFETSGLLLLVQMELHNIIQRHREDTRERLQWFLGVLKPPFTLNTRYMSDYKSKFLNYYKMYRYNVLNRVPMTYIQTYNSGRSVNYVSEVLSSLNKMNIKDVKASDLAKLLPEDDSLPALEVMAVVSAFFQVSSKEFIDIIPAIVDHDFVRGLSRTLQTALYSAIFKDDPRNRCKNLLKESPSAASRRDKLQRKYQRLEAARNELLSMRWRDI